LAVIAELISSSSHGSNWPALAGWLLLLLLLLLPAAVLQQPGE
jgi:hypothetical protein